MTGENYRKNLKHTDIAKIVRTTLRKRYPNLKFSILSGWATYTPTIDIYLMEADENPFHEWSRNYESIVNWGYTQLNEYALEKEGLKDWAYEAMRFAVDLLSSFNYDNSDPMTDYFDVNFYTHVGVGRYDKKFKIRGSKC